MKIEISICTGLMLNDYEEKKSIKSPLIDIILTWMYMGITLYPEDSQWYIKLPSGLALI